MVGEVGNAVEEIDGVGKIIIAEPDQILVDDVQQHFVPVQARGGHGGEHVLIELLVGGGHNDERRFVRPGNPGAAGSVKKAFQNVVVVNRVAELGVNFDPLKRIDRTQATGHHITSIAVIIASRRRAADDDQALVFPQAKPDLGETDGVLGLRRLRGQNAQIGETGVVAVGVGRVSGKADINGVAQADVPLLDGVIQIFQSLGQGDAAGMMSPICCGSGAVTSIRLKLSFSSIVPLTTASRKLCGAQNVPLSYEDGGSILHNWT